MAAIWSGPRTGGNVGGHNVTINLSPGLNRLA